MEQFCGIRFVTTKEVEKVVIEKALQTVVTITIEMAAMKTTANTMEMLFVDTFEKTVNNSEEKIDLESFKELANSGLKKGSDMINVAKGALLEASIEAEEIILFEGSKKSIKTII